jgi:hypothetical protein
LAAGASATAGTPALPSAGTGVDLPAAGTGTAGQQGWDAATAGAQAGSGAAGIGAGAGTGGTGADVDASTPPVADAGADPGGAAVCAGDTPHGCYVPKTDNPMGCPPQIHEQSAGYPPQNEWVACSSPNYVPCNYDKPSGGTANCSCDLGLHWLCTY